MFSKYSIALAALVLVGGSSIANAYDDVEAKVGDRYPYLEEGYRPVAPKSGRTNRTPAQNAAGHERDDVEAKVGDRYPFLDESYQTATANGAALRRTVAPTMSRNQNIEDPEAKIADRYPSLEHVPQYARVRVITVAGAPRPMKSVASAKKLGNRS